MLTYKDSRGNMGKGRCFLVNLWILRNNKLYTEQA